MIFVDFFKVIVFDVVVVVMINFFVDVMLFF